MNSNWFKLVMNQLGKIKTENSNECENHAIPFLRDFLHLYGGNNGLS